MEDIGAPYGIANLNINKIDRSIEWKMELKLFSMKWLENSEYENSVSIFDSDLYKLL